MITEYIKAAFKEASPPPFPSCPLKTTSSFSQSITLTHATICHTTFSSQPISLFLHCSAIAKMPCKYSLACSFFVGFLPFQPAGLGAQEFRLPANRSLSASHTLAPQGQSQVSAIFRMVWWLCVIAVSQVAQTAGIVIWLTWLSSWITFAPAPRGRKLRPPARELPCAQIAGILQDALNAALVPIAFAGEYSTLRPAKFSAMSFREASAR